MARRRRQEVASDSAWPIEFSVPDAPPWQGSRAFSEWCQSNGISSHDESTPDARRVRAIREWVRAHHPSPRWPQFPDQHWLNASGLRAVEQAAERAERLGTLRVGTHG